MSETFMRPAGYTVSVFPDWMRDSADMLIASESDTWSVSVEWRGRGKWAVYRLGSCLSADGQWDYEPSPSNREDEWLDAHRFDLETALHLAREHAPHVTINGYTAMDILAKLQRHAGSIDA